MPAPKKPRKLATEELFEYAVKCLGSRSYSTGDLRNKLRLRAARLPDVDETVNRLKEIGYLNDQRFAESYATARVENQGFGKMRVLTDLRKHRIGGTLADEAVEKALDGKCETELIDSYIERRMSSIAAAGPIEDEKTLASAYRRLRRAGFTSRPILEALKRIAARPEDIEEFPDEEQPENEERD